jgi:hypothetical protein
MRDIVRIYVQLVSEPVQVWRPVSAKLVKGDVYRIVDQQYDRDIERWEFEPGAQVTCKVVSIGESRVLAAVETADPRNE